MKDITPKLFQQIVSIVQPICTKADAKNYTVDQLYHKVVNLIVQAVMDMEKDNYEGWREARDKMVIGDKASVLDALKVLEPMAMRRREFNFKYKATEKSKPVDKTLTMDDLDIIQHFISRLDEAKDFEGESE